jgi:hypothetical protein
MPVHAPAVRLEEGEPADHATHSSELLGQDPELREAVPRASWNKLVRNWRHFIEDALEGWLNEGRTFASEEAKKEAIGRLVDGTLAKVKKSPRKWMKEHCDR